MSFNKISNTLSAKIKAQNIAKVRGSSNFKYDALSITSRLEVKDAVDFAKNQSKKSRIEYAIIKGQSLLDLQKDGNLNKVDQLFNWIEKNKAPMMLIIDDIDIVLESNANGDFIQEILSIFEQKKSKVILVLCGKNTSPEISKLMDQHIEITSNMLS